MLFPSLQSAVACVARRPKRTKRILYAAAPLNRVLFSECRIKAYRMIAAE
jgi:hypothetical protein